MNCNFTTIHVISRRFHGRFTTTKCSARTVFHRMLHILACKMYIVPDSHVSKAMEDAWREPALRLHHTRTSSTQHAHTSTQHTHTHVAWKTNKPWRAHIFVTITEMQREACARCRQGMERACVLSAWEEAVHRGSTGMHARKQVHGEGTETTNATDCQGRHMHATSQKTYT